jgi:hypothetical protein
MNKIEIVTSVGFSFHTLKGCTVKKLKNVPSKTVNYLIKVTGQRPCTDNNS